MAHVVEGSVQRAANKVRVSAAVDRRATREHLWGQTYDRDLADVFAIQSEILGQIPTITGRLSPTEKLQLSNLPRRDLTAFDLFYTRAKTLAAVENYLRAHKRITFAGN